MKLVGQITALFGFAAIVYGISVWIAHAEDAHKEHEQFEKRFEKMIEATSQLQEYEIRRQEREEMARELRMRVPSVASRPPEPEEDPNAEAE